MTIKTLSLYLAIVLTGLSAGLFYAWAVSIIPGTKKVPDLNYLQTMQSVNREILNPAFFLSFIVSLVMLSIASIQQYQQPGFWLVLLATLVYLIGTMGVTAFGNVPLNNELDVLQLERLAPEKITDFRQYFEAKWNRLHTIRTWFALLSFLLALASSFITKS